MEQDTCIDMHICMAHLSCLCGMETSRLFSATTIAFLPCVEPTFLGGLGWEFLFEETLISKLATLESGVYARTG